MLNYKKVILPSILILVALSVASYFGAKFISNEESETSVKLPKSFFSKNNDKFVTIGENKILIEIANTPGEWQIGLSEHDKLDKNHGMLFIFDKSDTRPSFWMEGMNFNIDIIWINDGKINQIEQNVPKPDEGTPSSELSLYKPYDVIDYVLEVNAGFVKEKGIAVGDTVDLSQVEEPN